MVKRPPALTDITSKHHKCTHDIALLRSYNLIVLIKMLVFKL
jgi:hypothetical protein